MLYLVHHSTPLGVKWSPGPDGSEVFWHQTGAGGGQHNMRQVVIMVLLMGVEQHVTQQARKSHLCGLNREQAGQPPALHHCHRMLGIVMCLWRSEPPPPPSYDGIWSSPTAVKVPLCLCSPPRICLLRPSQTHHRAGHAGGRFFLPPLISAPLAVQQDHNQTG